MVLHKHYQSISYLLHIFGSNNRKPWCAFKVNRRGIVVKGKWADCNSNCPIEGKPCMSNNLIEFFPHTFFLAKHIHLHEWGNPNKNVQKVV